MAKSVEAKNKELAFQLLKATEDEDLEAIEEIRNKQQDLEESPEWKGYNPYKAMVVGGND